MSFSLTTLLIEDAEEQACLIREILGRTGEPTFAVDWAPSLQAGVERLAEGEPDVVLLDLTLGDSKGLATFESVQSRAPHLPIVVLSGSGDEAVGLEAVKRGAEDYLMKDGFDLRALPKVLLYAVERRRARRELSESRAQLEHNIHDFKAAVQELEVQRQRLRRIDELHAHFLSTVSHELKSPVSVIKAAVGLLQDETTSPAQGRELLTTIEERSDRLLELITSILDLSRLESAKQGLELKPVEAASFCRSVARAMGLLAAQKGIRLQTDVAEGLPKAWFDPARMEQVLNNLLANALKFTPRGGEVRLSLRAAAGWLEASVEDSGPGIPEENRERVFDRFWQADPAAAPGLGLGLAICKEIVCQHRGRIWVEGTPGGGSRFVLRLPVDARSPARPSREVLVIDDDESLCALLEAMLAAEGHRVERLTNGRLAIERLRERPLVDLVFVDLLLPEADGVKVIQAARAHQPQAHLAVVTGFPNTRLFYDAMSYGPLTVLAKPFRREHLRGVLDRLAEVSR